MFTDPNLYPSLRRLSEKVEVIAAEFRAAMAAHEQVRMAMQAGMVMDFPSNQWAWDNGINRETVGYDLRDGGFSMLALYKRSEAGEVRNLEDAFPETLRLVSAIDNLHYVALTALLPGAHIRPHAHVRSHLVYHLLLNDLHGGTCEMRCAADARILRRAGDCVLFDYSHTHESTNRAASTRFNLMIDFAPCDAAQAV
ncbi:MAG: hypothetical protein C0462_12255 [Alcanivorax sp.]|nr:hypothetical protein [Alcanivorax sp.]